MTGGCRRTHRLKQPSGAFARAYAVPQAPHSALIPLAPRGKEVKIQDLERPGDPEAGV